MHKLHQQQERLHGLLFDGAVFISNIVLLKYVPPLGENVLEPVGGAWLLLAVTTQIGGAWWKRGYLTRRLARRKTALPKQGPERVFMNLLLFFHFLLFSLVALMALGLLGIYDFGDSGRFWRGDVWVPVSLGVGVLATYSVWAAENRGPSNLEPVHPPEWLEYGADVLLWVSVSIVTRIFWDGLLMEIGLSQGSGPNLVSIVLLAALSILFTVFYLPARYLFLVEDYPYPLTWLRAWAAMLPVAWFVLVG